MTYGPASRHGRRTRRSYALGSLVAACWLCVPAVGQPNEPAESIAPADGTAAADGTAPADGAAPSGLDDVAANQAFLTATIAESGRNTLRTAEAYIGLANSQRAAGDFEGAAESYVAAVEVYRAVDGAFTPLAIPPLTSLGDNYSEAGDHTNAVAVYSEARTVSRRVFGLHNEDQIELLDKLSRSMLDLDQPAEADAQQLEALRLIQRSHAPDSDEVLQGIYRYAQWLGQRSAFQLERDQYGRALRIIRSSYGNRDARQVTPLLGIGNTYRRERNPAGMGSAALQDALALLLEQPERDPVAIATALRDIGDWTVAFSKTGYDAKEYLRAWELLGEAAEGARLRDEWFSGANYVLYEPISPRGLSSEPDALDGFVIARFDLDTQGNTSDVAVVEASPAGFKDEAVLRHIRRSRFRPLIVGGQLVRGDDLAIQFRFRYLQDAVASNTPQDTD
jgi:TonB family protein